MNILQVARTLRPGTSWNYDGTTLSQAIDGTMRVPVPTDKEIQEYIAANPDPIDLSKQIAKDTTATTSARLDAITKILGL